MTSLERQLANDEPKCWNCEHWDPLPLKDGHGYCERAPHQDERDAVITTDLSLCSKWEPKKPQSEFLK